MKEKGKESVIIMQGNDRSSTSVETSSTVVDVENSARSLLLGETDLSSRALRSVSRRRRGLQRLEKIKSADIEMSPLNSEIPKSVDVVADIHYESERKKSISTESPRLISATWEEQIIKNDEGAGDSVTKREEITETATESFTDRLNKTKFESSNEVTEIDETQHRRKRWSCAEKDVGDLKMNTKPRRKRWSKDTKLLRLLAENEEGSSSTTSSNRGTTSRKESRSVRGPIPAPRSKNLRLKKENIFVGSENPAFESDHEEVLRIETDYKDRTRIEMRKMDTRQMFSEDEDPSEVNDNHTNKVRHEMKNERIKTAREKVEQVVYEIFDETQNEILEIHNGQHDTLINENNDRTIMYSRQLKDSDDSTAESIKSYGFQISALSPKRSSIKTNLNSQNQSSSETRTSTANYDSVDRSKSSRRIREKSSGRRERKLLKSKHVKADEEEELIRRKDKKKKKKNIKDKKNHAIRPQEFTQERNVIKEMKYISITIHGSDMLETDYITKHPMVKVHMVDENTGTYLKIMKNDTNKVTYLQPLITGKFDFKENRSIIPVWEEELIFEYDFDTIIKPQNGRVLILFEIVDLLSFAEASFNYDRYGSDGCWYKIAWAFLKPLGTNGAMHVDRKIRLQLYKPQRNLKKVNRTSCEVFHWWKSSIREKYPASLCVTVTSVDPPKLEPVVYDQLSLDRSLSQRTHSTSKKSQNGSANYKNITQSLDDSCQYERSKAQSCKIPNELLFENEISENGCFYVSFSNNGKYLACAISEEYNNPILVYGLNEDSGEILVRFLGHKNFIYSLNWSEDDHYVLSVSSDQTAKLWNVLNKDVHYVQILPHPSYVYCGKFVPGNSSIIATGCYDRIPRIWAKNRRSKVYELVQELSSVHQGFITSLCFRKDSTLLTADGVGIILIWTMKKNRLRSLSASSSSSLSSSSSSSSSSNPLQLKWEYRMSRKIKIRELENIIINTILMHPLGSRLLVHSRDNSLKMLDLETGVVLQRYQGLKNRRMQITACISPCGSLVLCGSEDATLNVWNLETGNLLAKYNESQNSGAIITCVDYHPHRHVIAYSVFKNPAVGVKILRYDRNSTGKTVGLQLHVNAEDVSNVSIEIIRNRQEFQGRYDDNEAAVSNSFASLNRKKNKEEKSIRERSHSRDTPSSLKDLTLQPNEDVCYASKRREALALRIRELNESDENIRTRNANRLSDIIEKIDRILSNATVTSRKTSRQDIELTTSSSLCDSKSLDKGNSNLKENLISKISEQNVRNKNGKTKSRRSKLHRRSHDDFSTSRESDNNTETPSSAPDTGGTYTVGSKSDQDTFENVTSDYSGRSNATFIIDDDDDDDESSKTDKKESKS